MTQTAEQHYLMINDYRNSTSDGFSNTWILMRCKSRAERAQILRDGLPVKDVSYNDGTQRCVGPAQRQAMAKGNEHS